MTERQMRILEQYRRETAERVTFNYARNMLNKGADPDFISSVLELSQEDMASILKRLQA